LWFYKLNPELFKQDMNNELVEKAIIKTTAILESRMRFDLRPNMAVELMRRNNALSRYIAEIGVANMVEEQIRRDNAMLKYIAEKQIQYFSKCSKSR
jgi:hypothetical protein